MQPTIKGLQELQRWNLRAIANAKPDGEYGRALRNILTQLERYEVAIIHVDTGALRASPRIELRGLSGRVYLDPTATNPRTRQKTSIYGAVENARGGEHAFGERTVHEAAPRIVGTALAMLGRSLE